MDEAEAGRRLRTRYRMSDNLRLLRYPRVVATVVAVVVVQAVVRDRLHGPAGLAGLLLTAVAGVVGVVAAVKAGRDREARRQWTDPRPPWQAVRDHAVRVLADSPARVDAEPPGDGRHACVTVISAERRIALVVKGMRVYAHVDGEADPIELVLRETARGGWREDLADLLRTPAR
ncbi:MAG: hypothetical protein ACJ73S_33155 [Mycobacteriales bacterium]